MPVQSLTAKYADEVWKMISKEWPSSRSIDDVAVIASSATNFEKIPMSLVYIGRLTASYTISFRYLWLHIIFTFI